MPSPGAPTSRSGADVDVVEVHRRRGGAGQAHLALGRAERQPIGAGVHQEAGQPPRRLVTRAREDRVEVGLAAVGDPGLGAGQHPAALRGPRLRRDGRDVGAGLGLGQAVGAQPVAGQQPGQQLLLLVRRAELGERVAGQAVHRDADRHGQPGVPELLQHLQVALVGLRTAAEPLRVGQREQPGPAEQREPVAREGPALLGLGRPRGQLGRRDPTGELDQVLGVRRGQHPVDRHGPTLRARVEECRMDRKSPRARSPNAL